MANFTAGLPALASPAVGIQAPNPLNQLLQTAAQYPQIAQQAQINQANQQAALMKAQSDQKQQATAQLQQLVAAGQQNQTLQQNPQYRQRLAQLYKAVTGSDQLPTLPSAPAQANATQPAAAPQQQPATGAQAPSPYQTGGVQQQAPGAYTFGPAGSIQSTPKPQAAAAPASLDLNAIAPGDNPLADLDQLAKFNALPKAQKILYAQAHHLNLPPEAFTDPQYTLSPQERSNLSTDYYKGIEAVSSGKSTPEAFIGWAEAQKDNLRAIGISDPIASLKSSGGFDKISADATARIQDWAKKGALSDAQAKAMIAKLGPQIANIQSKTDLDRVMAAYKGVQMQELPLEVQSRIQTSMMRAQAAVSQAQTSAARLTEHIKEFAQTGGSMKGASGAAFRNAHQEVQEERSQAAFLRSQISSLQSQNQQIINTKGKPSQDILDQIGNLRIAESAANQRAVDGERQINEIMRQGFVTQGQPGVVNSIKPLGDTNPPKGLPQSLIDAYSNADSDARRDTLRDPHTTQEMRTYLIERYGV